MPDTYESIKVVSEIYLSNYISIVFEVSKNPKIGYILSIYFYKDTSKYGGPTNAHLSMKVATINKVLSYLIELDPYFLVPEEEILIPGAVSYKGNRFCVMATKNKFGDWVVLIRKVSIDKNNKRHYKESIPIPFNRWKQFIDSSLEARNYMIKNKMIS